MNKYSLLIMIIVPHDDYQKSCYVLPLIIEVQERDMPAIKHMLETHYQHSEFLQCLIENNYPPSEHNQAVIHDLKTMMECSECLYADFYPPSTLLLNRYIKIKLNELRTRIRLHVCKSTFSLN